MDTKIGTIVDTKGGSVESVDSGVMVREAVARMNEKNIGSVLVLDGDRLVGIFTERDVLTRIVAAMRDPAQVRVGEVMTRQMIVIERGTTVAQAMSLMTTRRCRHLPVLDGGKVIGLISIGDLTRWVIHDQERSITDLTDYIHRA